MIEFLFIPIDREGKYFFLIFLAVTFALGFFSSYLGILMLIITIWCVYFFRDPIRVVPVEEGIILGSADGLITKIDENVSLPAEIAKYSNEKKWTRVSTFLSIFDVHVNRIPISGTIKKAIYKKGKFLNAITDKSSELNERYSTIIDTGLSKDIVVVQIAGLIARRIRHDLEEKQIVEAGQKLGFIRFGSRVDIYLPTDVIPLVIKGQRVIGGETVIAHCKVKNKRRVGKLI